MDGQINATPQADGVNGNGTTASANRIGAWLRSYWALFPLLLLALDFYWMLWGSIAAVILGVVLIAVLAADAFKLKRSTVQTLKRYGPAIAVLAIISLSMYIRLFGFFTPEGSTRWQYLRNIDSFFFQRHIEDVLLNNGTIPAHDSLIRAPMGYENVPGQDLYYYLGAYAYTIANVFSPQALWQFLAWFAPLLASLIAIPAYYIGRLLFDKKAGILTSLFMVFMTPFMSRSLGGDPDSDAIVMLMVACSIAAFLLMYKGMDKTKIFARRNVLLSLFFAIFLALFAYTWSGYWFTIWIVGSFIVLKIVVDFILHRKHKEDHIRIIWKHTKGLVVLSVLSVIIFEVLTAPYMGLQASTTFITSPISQVFGGGFKGEAGHFPNVGVSIAELQTGGDARNVAIQASGLDAAAGISGLPLGLLMIVSPFLLTLACFVYLMYSYYKRREHLDTLLFMGIWFVGFLFGSVIAVRFTIFLAPVYAICSSIMISKMWRVAAGEDRSIGA